MIVEQDIHSTTVVKSLRIILAVVSARHAPPCQNKSHYLSSNTDNKKYFLSYKNISFTHLSGA
jgi:hypothetical protein